MSKRDVTMKVSNIQAGFQRQNNVECPNFTIFKSNQSISCTVLMIIFAQRDFIYKPSFH